MYEAARVGDPISHTSALAGFLIGALLGVALIAAVAFATFTCGFGVALLAGLAAGLGAQGLLAAGEAIGRAMRTVTGAIATGSLDVFTNLRPAAHAIRSTVGCSKDTPVQFIAEGSTSVFINNQPAARKGDHTTCDAEVDDGSPDVFIGGGTAQYLPIEREIPDKYRTYVDWAFAAAGLVGGLAGLVRKAAGAPLRALLPCAGRYIAGYMAGEALSRYVVAPAISRAWGALTGHPVEATTGRKLLLAQQEIDGVVDDLLPIIIQRFYSSGIATSGLLGQGWRMPWDITLHQAGGRIIYTDLQGRETAFPWVAPGENSFSAAEQKFLTCLPDGRYLIHDLDQTYLLFSALPSDGQPARLARQEDALGQALAFIYDTDRLVSITTPNGDELRCQYHHSTGRLAALIHYPAATDGALSPSTLVRYEYDHNGQLSAVYNQQNQLTRRFSYENGLMVQQQDQLGFTCHYRWENIGGQPRVIEHTTNTGEHYQYRYDPANRQSWMTDSLGRTAHWQYDEHHQIIAYQDLDGSEYRTQYNDDGHPTQFQLPGDRQLQLEFDALGRIQREIDPLGQVTQYQYHGNTRQITQLRLPDGGDWQAEYDVHGRLIRQQDPLGHAEHYEYDRAFQPKAHIDARGGRRQFFWTARGKPQRQVDCSGKTTHFHYDAQHRLIGVTDALGQQTHYQRDEAGRITRIELADGSSELFEYSGSGLLSRYLDPQRMEQQWQYDVRGLLISHRNVSHHTTRYDYDAYGRLTKLTNPNGAAYRFEYDAADRLISEHRLDQLSKHYQYHPAGWLSAETTIGQAAGQSLSKTVRLTHDLLGRLIKRETGTAVFGYTYDPLGRPLHLHRTPTPFGLQMGVQPDAIQFEYDAAGQLTQEHGRHGRVQYQHDELGNLIQLMLPQGHQLGFLHYGSGHLHQIRFDERVITDIERDDLHRETLRSQGRLHTAFGYDALGRKQWQSSEWRQPAPLPAMPEAPLPQPGSGVLWRQYQYNQRGDLLQQRDGLRGQIELQYNPAGYLISRRTEAPFGQSHLQRFQYDPAGNLQGSEGLVQDNRLRVYQDLRFDYDAYGNLIEKRKGSHTTLRLVYDADDQLLLTEQTCHDTRTITRFDYDVLGRRIGKTVSSQSTLKPGPAHTHSTTRFIWQGLRLLQEIHTPGTQAEITHTYVYETDQRYSPLARIDQWQDSTSDHASTQLYYFHTDQIGTPQEVTDEAGQLVWAGRYQAWGKLEGQHTTSGQSTLTQPLRFAGQYADDSTGLHYNTFRYYDPDVGRFINHDPIGLNGGFNLYAYAPNPTGWIDPWGLATVDAIFEMAGQIFTGVNPTERTPRVNGSTIPGLAGPNSSRFDMHAEIDAMMKAYDANLRGGRGVLTVEGLEVCAFCKRSIKNMAKALNLDEFIVHEISSGKTYTFTGRDLNKIREGGKGFKGAC
ncbi:RHS repeat-associated protein [Chitinivorax tropicus]|uniref:RHS repeat-associated protein n=1 Tax=Chitinivorax tropicus TaxID=714531 RepID=A0A840MIU1_9PROT|nr:RHS repeat-associated core domain-containing protein [Chitinivorax tropicus]MBB5018568.1 RHS repeat-associated protein [Chitinivorax tropicus]